MCGGLPGGSGLSSTISYATPDASVSPPSGSSTSEIAASTSTFTMEDIMNDLVCELIFQFFRFD